MSVKPKQVKKLGKNVAKFGLVVVGSGILTALGMVLLWLLPFEGPLPAVQVRSLGITVASEVVGFLGLYPVVASVGVVVVFFREQVGEKATQTTAQVAELPDVGQSATMGIPFAVGATLAFATVNYLWFGYHPGIDLGIGAFVWLLVTGLSFVQLRGELELSGVARVLVLAGIAAVVVASGVRAVDLLLGDALPDLLALGTVLVVAPVAALLGYAMVTRSGALPDPVSRLLVRVGLAQILTLKTVTVSLFVGFVPAMFVAVVLTLALGAALNTVVAVLLGALAFVPLFAVGSALTMLVFKRFGRARTDLAIVDVRDRSSGDNLELAVRNEGDEPVDLRDAKIRDTSNDKYRTNIDLVLGGGQTGQFDIPPGFSLFPTDSSYRLAGFEISRSNRVPAVVTRDGKKYELRWSDSMREQLRALQGTDTSGSGRTKNKKKKKKKSEDRDLDDEFEKRTGIDKLEKRTGKDIDIEDVFTDE